MTDGWPDTRRELYDETSTQHQVSLAHRKAIDRAIGALVAALRRAGVSYDEGHEPMTDVDRINIVFRANGNFRRPELLVGGRYEDGSGCMMYLALEPYPDEEEEKNR